MLVDWFRSHSRTRLLKLLRRHGVETEDLRVQVVRRHLRDRWGQQGGAGADPVQSLKPVMAAHILEILTSYRIGPNCFLDPEGLGYNQLRR